MAPSELSIDRPQAPAAENIVSPSARRLPPLLLPRDSRNLCPPIKVERYDGVVSSTDHVADFFASVVANLDTVKGSVLTDPSRGFWTGARYVGVTRIAIVRQGKVVGMHARVGRADKDALPPE